MSTLSSFSPRQEIYSIDECYLDLEGFDPSTLMAYQYKKSGVLLMGLQAKGLAKATLFDEPEMQIRSDNRMRVMDAINQKMGKGSMTIAASGIRQRWAMRRNSKSPNYTTDWQELPLAW